MLCDPCVTVTCESGNEGEAKSHTQIDRLVQVQRDTCLSIHLGSQAIILRHQTLTHLCLFKIKFEKDFLVFFNACILYTFNQCKWR